MFAKIILYYSNIFRLIRECLNSNILLKWNSGCICYHRLILMADLKKVFLIKSRKRLCLVKLNLAISTEATELISHLVVFFYLLFCPALLFHSAALNSVPCYNIDAFV